MPHKRNPITAERISGLARVVRGYAVAALEDVALWHERDISHSSVERVILPDAFLGARLHAAPAPASLMEGLVVRARPDARRARVRRTGWSTPSASCWGWWSGASPASRPTRIVQRNAMRAWDEERPLGELLAADPEVTAALTADDVEALLDPAWYTRHVPELMQRVAAL